MKLPRDKIVFICSLFLISIYFYGGDNLYAESSEHEKAPTAQVKKKRQRKVKVEAHDDDVKGPAPISGENNLKDDFSGIASQDGIQTVLVLDSSRSMNKTDPKRVRDQGARLFLQFLEPSDFFSIVQFSDEAKVVVPFSLMSKVTSEELASSLSSIENDGNFTDFLSGIELAESLFDESQNP